MASRRGSRPFRLVRPGRGVVLPDHLVLALPQVVIGQEVEFRGILQPRHEASSGGHRLVVIVVPGDEGHPDDHPAPPGGGAPGRGG